MSESLWWHNAVIYQVYPRSFADGNGDGIGDLQGVLSRLDHFSALGVDAVWFSPFYPSPQRDTGYDVADYFSINPEYGDLELFKKVVERLQERGIHTIIDLVPNHTSDRHAWFQELVADPDNPALCDRYVIREAADYPNNWGSMFGGRAWDRLSDYTGRQVDRNRWYLHLFDRSQPDLNWENEEVHAMFDRFLRFWCDLGVDGFRVDVAHGCVKAAGLPDDEIGPDRWGYQGSPDDIQTGPMYDQEGVHNIYRRWRRVLDEYGPEKMLVAEAWVPSAERLARYVRPDEMSQSFNFPYLEAGWHPGRLREVIDQSLAANGAVGAPTTWVLNNHDVTRATTRFAYDGDISFNHGIGPDDPQPPHPEVGRARALALFLFTAALPGSLYMFQGEEFGLPEHTMIPASARQDPTFARTGGQVPGRDGCRVPLPWSPEPAGNFGFSTSPSGAVLCEASRPWLPQPDSWGEFAPTDTNPTLSLYRKALQLRRKLGLGQGNWVWLEGYPTGVLAGTNGKTRILLNCGETEIELPASPIISTAAAEDSLPPNSAAWLKAED